MDLTINTASASTDTENDIPPPKPLCYANGAPKPRPRPYPAPPVVYRECLRNHAASIGGHALDGCGEFMPSSAVPDPSAPNCAASLLTCAACGCHRNFHRREERHVISPESSPSPPSCYPAPTCYPAPPQSSPLPQRCYPAPPCYSAPSSYPAPPHPMLFALSTAVGEEPINFAPVAIPATPKGENANPRERKRFRTKFSKEQKDEMFSFSEKLGWKMPRADDVGVVAFCDKVGVTKGVLKVWMHNNKHTFAKKGHNFVANESNLRNNEPISNGVSANDISNHPNESNNGSSSSA